MKERPILFSGPMVRAIIEGRKTQTRRIVKPQPAPVECGSMVPFGMVGDWVWPNPKIPGAATVSNKPTGPTGWVEEHCPYGQPGDRLWVRETWGLHAYRDETDWLRASLRGLSADEVRGSWMVEHQADYGPQQEAAFWRPSIHMPRWASRLTLEVTEVRVERLQDISEEDAKAEGAEAVLNGHGAGEEDRPVPSFSHRKGFRQLWDSINADRASWASNPWVWVVSFQAANQSLRGK